ncbi:hypothetical protein HDV63DRAFT_65615 [Trichoderma sp. SZMC 28014]
MNGTKVTKGRAVYICATLTNQQLSCGCMSIVGKRESFGRGLKVVVNSPDTSTDMRLNEAWQIAHLKQLFAFSHLSLWLRFVERLILRLPALETFNQQVFVSVDIATDQLFHSMARAHGRSCIICNWIQRRDRPVGRLMLQTWLSLQWLWTSKGYIESGVLSRGTKAAPITCESLTTFVPKETGTHFRYELHEPTSHDKLS